MPFKTILLPDAPDYLAPDGSEIRLLPSLQEAGLSHCILPPNALSRAVKHHTVEEVWYFLRGEGEVWRKWNEVEEITNVYAGISLKIGVGVHFQFRNTGSVSLEMIIMTSPCWPGKEEAEPVAGKWDTDSQV